MEKVNQHQSHCHVGTGHLQYRLTGERLTNWKQRKGKKKSVTVKAGAIDAAS